MPIIKTPLIRLEQDSEVTGIPKLAEAIYDPSARKCIGIILDSNKVLGFVIQNTTDAPDESVRINHDLRFVAFNIISQRESMPLSEFIPLLPNMGTDGAELLERRPRQLTDQEAMKEYEENTDCDIIGDAKTLPVTLHAYLKKLAVARKMR